MMIEKLMTNSRTTEVDAALVRMIGAYRNTSLNSDAYLADLFAGLEGQSEAIRRMKAESVLEEKDEMRDAALRSVFFMVQGMMYHFPTPRLSEAETRGLLAVVCNDTNYPPVRILESLSYFAGLIV